MNKKKLIFIGLASFAGLVFFCGTAQETGFTMSGYIQGLSNRYLYLNWQQGEAVKIDSVMVSNGHFKFKGSVQDPSLAVLFLKGQRPVRFYLENKTLEVTGKADAMRDLSFKGSVSQDEFSAFNKSISGIRNEEELISKSRAFITSHPASYVSADKLLELAPRMDYSTLQQLFDQLQSSVKHSVAGTRLYKLVNIYKNTSVGSIAPAVVQQDVNGKTIRLSDLRGKYVLLDFWASWCVPCRKENPVVLKAYNRFHNKGLQILAVSLDDKAENWKKAIEEDQMPWLQVSDLKGTENRAALEYGIFSIPANFLIDPEGKIIAKDLRGEALESKLSEVFSEH